MRRILAVLAVAGSCSPAPRSPSSTTTAVGSGARAAAAIVDARVVDAAVADARLADAPFADAAAKKYAKQGEVCSFGSRHPATDKLAPVTCAPGLQCCYPCGIQGCDSTCMTPAQCNVRRP